MTDKHTATVTFTDKFGDVLSVNRSMSGSLHLRQREVMDDKTTAILLAADVAEQVRDKLIELYPLTEAEPEVVPAEPEGKRPMNLEVTDDAGDTLKISRSDYTGRAYFQVNDGMQVRLYPEDQRKVVDFLTPIKGEAVVAAEPVPEKKPSTFFLLRQKKSNPVKVKVCFASTPDAKEYRIRAEAEMHARQQNAQYPEWNYFVVEKEAV